MNTKQAKPSHASTLCVHASLRSVLLTLLLSAGAHLSAQPMPHQFSGITALPDETVSLTLDGSVSNMFNLTGTISNQFMQMFDLYPVEVSSNLLDWTPLAMLLRTNTDPNPLPFQDTNAAGFDKRFYRTPTNHLLTASLMPTGPYAVGTVDRVMVDPARTNLYRYSPPTNAFMVTFWYPAERPPAGTLQAAMWDQGMAADTNFYAAVAAAGFSGADTQWAGIVPKLVGHQFHGAPLAAQPARFPVILSSHGWAANRTGVSQSAGELASHGYVVVAIDHGDCFGTQFPDGRYLHGTAAGGSGVTSADRAGRLQDMQFLLDELIALDRSDPLLAGRLDLDRIGARGISAGGIVIDTCRADDRVKCAAIYDGGQFTQTPPGLQKPLLAAVGEISRNYSRAQWLFNQAISNAVCLQIHGAGHITASDWGWIFETPQCRPPAMAHNACLVWFFDTYLKGESPPFPTNPELYNVMRK